MFIPLPVGHTVQMIKLYQFPISHYCEKVRWALAYKGLDHTLVTLLPGLHIRKVKKMTGRTMVPVFVHDKKILDESSEIISYLDETFPEKRLTPDSPGLEQEALEWERFADEKIGVHVRRVCYHTLLDYPEIVMPFFTVNGPWYGKLVVKRMFPEMRIAMRKFMNINSESARQSRQILDESTDRVFSHLQGREFLVGDQFTRADLAVASLLAPLAMPAQYGLDWPTQYPEELDELIGNYSEKLQWVNRLYKAYR